MKQSIENYIVTGLMAAPLFLVLFFLSWKLFATEPMSELSTGIMHATSAKMSYKGLIWKTYDGWIPIGVNNEGGLDKWVFTATSKNVAECIENNKHVKLYYKDYIGMPFRFGYSHQVYQCEEE